MDNYNQTYINYDYSSHWHERTGIAEVLLTWQSMILNHMLKLASISHLVIVVHYGVVVYNTIFNDISAISWKSDLLVQL
jgi:hypothetical protein